MRSVYLAMEAMGAIVILILLYANAFELKQTSKKKRIFTRLLIANESVVVFDMVTWMQFDWVHHPVSLSVLVTLTYLVPFYTLACFSRYLYEHIAARSKISRVPFRIVIYYSIVIGLITTILCVSGNMFSIQDGKYCAGAADSAYYLSYIIALVVFCVVILVNGRKLGLHDMIGALTFCLIPFVSILISTSSLGINLAVPGMAIEVLVIYVLLQSEQESTLRFQSYNDEMTGLLNRRAYEDYLQQCSTIPKEPDFVFASIDINGLKQVNDSLGHEAGDELICGAAYCLQRTLGNHGEVYRVGGDEFVAIFFADAEKFQFLVKDLEMVAVQWKGTIVDSLAISVGYATKREFPDKNIHEFSEIAEKRMYEEKNRYYADQGVDRKGRAAAHTALCNLYTKILKVNLTTDTYTIINMDDSEMLTENGFADSISGWLSGFGKSGSVYEEDLELYLQKTDLEYLRAYFRNGKVSYSFWYRRRYGDVFKRVAMDIIPAEDYTHDHQSLYLYVRSIEI